MLKFKKIETREELHEAYNLRFRVYCEERAFEPEIAYPDRCERDKYDTYSIHFIAKFLPTGQAGGEQTIGTVRLVLNNPDGFPLEKHCILDSQSAGLINRERTAEISRFAISKNIIKSSCCDRRTVVTGLFREIYQESKKTGIDYFYAVMGKGLQKLLARCGIIFFQVGPLIDYHGPRAPYISGIKHIEEGIFMKNFDLFRFITSPGLSLAYNLV